MWNATVLLQHWNATVRVKNPVCQTDQKIFNWMGIASLRSKSMSKFSSKSKLRVSCEYDIRTKVELFWKSYIIEKMALFSHPSYKRVLSRTQFWGVKRLLNLTIQNRLTVLFEIPIIIFVPGTKIDLREDRETLSLLSDQGLSPLKREQGQKLANKIRAVKYMECSALTQRGLKQVSFWEYFEILYEKSFSHRCLTKRLELSYDLNHSKEDSESV